VGRNAPLAASVGGLRCLWLAVLLAATAGCGTVKTPTEPSTPPGGGQAFTFSRIQGEIFTQACAKAGCHDAAAASGGMVLAAGSAYGQIVGRPSSEAPALARVQPGQPEASYLLKKVRGDADISGARMPRDGPPFLSASQIAGIAGWIQQGAPNN
jgi:hypothetical protein